MIADMEQLYRLYHRPVYLYLLRLSGSPSMAEDLLQETFYRAMRSALSFRGEASVTTWLCAIARRLFLTEFAKQKREQDRSTSLEPDLIPHGRLSLDAHVSQRDQIERTLQGLTEQQRVALLLRDADGLSYQEVADAMGLSLANTKVIIHRARLRFRLRYQEGEEGAE